MLDFWQEELSVDEEDRLIESVALTIERRKMTAPAILALEMHKPLAFVGASAAVAFSPFIVPFAGFDNVNNYSRLLQSRDNVERLIQRLERGPIVRAEGSPA